MIWGLEMIGKLIVSLSLAAILFGCSNDSASETDSSSASGMPVADVNDTRDSETAVSSGSFDMLVMDVFTISGKGVVVTGPVKSGAVAVGDTVCVSGGAPMTVDGIELRRETPDTLKEGDLGGLLIAGLLKDDVEKGSFVKSCN